MGYKSENGKISSLFVPERSERNVYKSENAQHFQQVLCELDEDVMGYKSEQGWKKKGKYQCGILQLRYPRDAWQN